MSGVTLPWPCRGIKRRRPERRHALVGKREASGRRAFPAGRLDVVETVSGSLPMPCEHPRRVSCHPRSG